MHTPARVLIVSSARNPQYVAMNEAFAAALEQRYGQSLRVQVAHFHDLVFVFEAGKPRAFLLDEAHTPLDDFDLLYLKSYSGRKGNDYVEHAHALAICREVAGLPFIGHEVAQAVSLTKLSQYAKLAAGGFPVPKALFIAPAELTQQYDLVAKTLGVPFILKDIGGFGGQYNFLVKDQQHYDHILAQYPEISFVAQTFIANEGDLRVLTIGGKVRMIIQRKRSDDTTHLNNTSQGADATLLPLNTLDQQATDMAQRAAAVFPREIAGVDIMFEKDTNIPYLLEVNAGPQVASGAFMDEKITMMGDFLTEVITNAAETKEGA